ncbi:hypothetical protein BJ322DRAFT_1025569 [Thelephora terrestris]|uniref:Uncharacterized protein n=1 Tax=Thelephora terrestris TaxID=56493 RepID=A0A9P6H3H2_9AGAM|nr:hypothetical protein BJ322DRAFT_1025569 [Thelephora terrestris]
MVHAVIVDANCLSTTAQLLEGGNIEVVARQSANEKVTEDNSGAERMEDKSPIRQVDGFAQTSWTLTLVREESNGRWTIGGGASSWPDQKPPGVVTVFRTLSGIATFSRLSTTAARGLDDFPQHSRLS